MNLFIINYALPPAPHMRFCGGLKPPARSKHVWDPLRQTFIHEATNMLVGLIVTQKDIVILLLEVAVLLGVMNIDHADKLEQDQD